MIARLLLSTSLAIAVASLAAAQSVPGLNRPGLNTLGTVESIGVTTIVLRPEGGGAQTFTLAPNLVVVQVKPATLADIKPDDFVASAAVRGADGKLHSTELRIFPAAMRGLGEGQWPMNDARSQTMTNATVTGTGVIDGSNHIKVTFAGGESELILDPGIPVTRLDSVDRGLVQGGMNVRLQGPAQESGLVNRITIQ